MSKHEGNVIVVVFIKHVGFCKENGGGGQELRKLRKIQ